MKLTKKLLGVAAIFAVIGFLALPLTGCPTVDDGDKTAAVPEDTSSIPTAGDFDIDNLTQEVANIAAVIITPKDGKSKGTITIYYDGSKTLPTEIGAYPVTFDVAASDGWKAANGLSAGTLNIVGHIFKNIDELKTWLSEQGENDKDHPYLIGLDVNDISPLREMLNNEPKKYVSIDLCSDQITTIPNNLFYGIAAPRGCATLTGISIPNSVTSIGELAFNDCASLTSINIPNNVTIIGSQAFSNSGLTTISVDSANTAYSSDNGVLYNKDKTTLILYPQRKADVSFTIPSSVTSIGDMAFYRCTNGLTITIPSSVANIGEDAFTRAYVTSVTFQGTISLDNFAENTFDTSGGNSDLRDKFYATDSTNGTPGTYTRVDRFSLEWTKQ